MKFGTFQLVENPEWLSERETFRQDVEIMQYAEELGFDEVWITEHHFNRYGLCTDPLLYATHVAAKTKRIRIGTAILVLPFHNPIRLAEQIAMVDILSDGRLDVGVGRGYQPVEYAGMNLPIDKGNEIFSEVLDVLFQAWTQPKVDFNGKYFTFKDTVVLPKPVQKPHPPVYVATSTPAKMREAARRGFRLMYGSVDTPAEQGGPTIQSIWEKIAREEGLPETAIKSAGQDFPKTVRIYVAETDEQAWREIQKPLAWFIEHFLGQSAGAGNVAGGQFSQYKESEKTFQSPLESFRDRDIYGSPETVARKIREMRTKTGVGNFVGWFSFGGLDVDKAKNSMRLFAKEVMPRLKD